MHLRIPKNFKLGAASSAWQTEGWFGKKAGQDSYLDAWYQAESFVWHEGQGPALATDFMRRYQEDIDLMSTLHLQVYRTSINWARFFTDYENCIVDEAYAQHISDVIDGLIAAQVEPMLCLEHYELPDALLKKYGGWASKIVVELYAKYATIAFERYGDRVKSWFTFNEPIVVQTRCYLDTIRWPHEQDTRKWMTWNINKAIASAKACQIYHEKGYDGRIGCILNPEMVYPRSTSAADLKAAHLYDLFFNKVFFDPMITGYYDDELIALSKQHGIWLDLTDDEKAILKAGTVDFLGINQYYPKRVRAPRYAWHPDAAFHPEMYYDNFVLPGSQFNPSRGWEIYPQIMYDMAIYLRDNYGDIPWIVSENGTGQANETQFLDDKGLICDDYRIDFISQHLAYLLKAVAEGANCEGYMLWAFTDNVSPMNAFKNRYGLVSIDLETRNRSLKKSAYWYQSLIETRLLDLPD